MQKEKEIEKMLEEIKKFLINKIKVSINIEKEANGNIFITTFGGFFMAKKIISEEEKKEKK